MYRFSKIAGKYKRDFEKEEYLKSKKDTNVFDGIDCIYKMLDWTFSSEVQTEKMKYKIFEYEIQLLVHNGSAFDKYF